MNILILKYIRTIFMSVVSGYLLQRTKKNTMVFTIAKDTNIFHKSFPMSSKLSLSCTIIGGIKNPSAAPS